MCRAQQRLISPAGEIKSLSQRSPLKSRGHVCRQVMALPKHFATKNEIVPSPFVRDSDKSSAKDVVDASRPSRRDFFFSFFFTGENLAQGTLRSSCRGDGGVVPDSYRLLPPPPSALPWMISSSRNEEMYVRPKRAKVRGKYLVASIINQVINHCRRVRCESVPHRETVIASKRNCK